MDEEQLFKIFKDNQEFFIVLISENVHLMRNGNAQLNFNNEKLSTIVMTQTVYKSR